MKDKIVNFSTQLSFKGTISEFEKVTNDLAKLERELGATGLTTNINPTAEGGIIIDLKFKGPISGFEKVMVGLGELRTSAPKIGTWPTPEKQRVRPTICTVPLPERILVGKLSLDKIVKGMPRVTVLKDIDGGIRNPHLHLTNEKVVLIDRARFKDLVGIVAMDAARELAERVDSTETVRAVSHLVPEGKEQASNPGITSKE